MPVDLAELFENTSAPPMHVNVEAILARGRRRRLRRRASTALTVLGAAALVVPAAAVLRMDVALSPGTSPSGHCLFSDPTPEAAGVDATDGVRMTGTPWLDSGPPGADRSIRVQVNIGTCKGLAVAVSKVPGQGQGVGDSVATADVPGRPAKAFWVYDATGGGVDRSGAVVPVTPSAVVLLPEGQQICGLATGPELSNPSGPTMPLSTPLTVPAGNGWKATFAGLPAVADPESAALRVCAGTRVVAPALRPLNAVVPTTATVDESTGAIVLPLDDYWPSELEHDELVSARGVALIMCKRSKGVTSVDELRRVIPDAPMHRFGVWRMADAQRYGYVEPMSDEKLAAIAENSDPSSNGPSQAELDAARECVNEDPIVQALDEQPATGPWERALSAAEEAAQSSQAWDDAVDDWARCLEDKGLSADRESMSADGVDSKALDERRVRPEDVTLAVADVTCKRQEDTIQRLADIVAAAQAPVIEQYKYPLQEQRAAIDQQLVVARQVLADAGL